MRISRTIGAWITTLALASSAQAIPEINLIDLSAQFGQGAVALQLVVDEDGLFSYNVDITSGGTGTPNLFESIVYGFTVDQGVGGCQASGRGNNCDFAAAGPFTNPNFPDAFTGIAHFVTSSGDRLQGATTLPDIGYGPGVFTLLQFDGPDFDFHKAGILGGEGTLGDGETSFDFVPEPTTASLLVLGLAGLGVGARRRR